MSDITDALDRIFVNADAIITELGDEFTSQTFLRRIMHDQQHAYIDLLVACKHLPIPFDQAHQKIGNRLEAMMAAQGYDKHRESGKDINIFNLPTTRTTYRRAK